jgi:hypothetical protein
MSLSLLDAAWQHYITPVLDFENYAVLIKSVR